MKISTIHLILVLVFSCLLACNSNQKSAVNNASNIESVLTEICTPDEAINALKDGNKRFLEKKFINTNYEEQIEASKENQKPHSLILTCMDSRVPPEIIFDQGIGNIFVVRNAGNIQEGVVLGSMEYAVKFAGSKLIVVLGHSHCGAVTGAIKNVESGNLTQIIEKIKPCIPVDCEMTKLVDETAKNNVQQTINEILENSETIRSLHNDNKIKLVAAFYDIETGVVSFDF